MKPEEDAFTHWMARFTQWAIAAADPVNHPSEIGREAIQDAQVVEMAESNVDLLLQAGIAPHRVAIALATAASLTVGEMINRYVPKDG